MAGAAFYETAMDVLARREAGAGWSELAGDQQNGIATRPRIKRPAAIQVQNGSCRLMASRRAAP